MNNQFNQLRKADSLKWIITFTLIAVLLIGMVASLVISINNQNAISNVPDQPNSGMVVTPDETNSMVKLSVKPMSASNEVSQLSETSYTVNATILPASAMQQAVWSVAWKNPSSSWANGKTISQYVSITPSEENSLTATLDCIKGFSEQIILTVSAKANTAKTATCTMDYKQRLIVNSLSLGGTALSTTTSNFKAQLGKMHMMEISYTYSDGTIPYLGKGEYNEFIAAGIAFTDEFITAYNANNGSLPELTRKMKRANVSSEHAHTREIEFTDGAYGNTVFYGIFGYFSDANMAALRTAVNTVGEGNVFKIGIFKTESAIDNGYVECDVWYKLGLQKDSVYMATESIAADNSGFVF